MRIKWYFLWFLYFLVIGSSIAFFIFHEEAMNTFNSLMERYPIGAPAIFAVIFAVYAGGAIFEKKKTDRTLYQIALFSGMTVFFLYKTGLGIGN